MDNIDPWIIVINTLAHFPDQHFPSFCLSEIWVTRNCRCIYHTAISGVRKNPQVPNPRSLSNSYSYKSWFIFLQRLYLAQIWPAAYWQDCCLREGACVCEEHLDETQSQDKWRLLLKDKCKESIVGYQQAAAHCWSKGKHSCINGIIVKCMQKCMQEASMVMFLCLDTLYSQKYWHPFFRKEKGTSKLCQQRWKHNSCT